MESLRELLRTYRIENLRQRLYDEDTTKLFQLIIDAGLVSRFRFQHKLDVCELVSFVISKKFCNKFKDKFVEFIIDEGIGFDYLDND